MTRWPSLIAALALLLPLCLVPEPGHAGPDDSIALNGSYSVSPDAMPGDINLAIAGIAQALRGHATRAPVDNVAVVRDAGEREAKIFAEFNVVGYRLNAVLPLQEQKTLGRKIAGRLYFKNADQLTMSVDFFAIYTVKTDRIQLEALNTKLIAPGNIRVKSFLIDATEYAKVPKHGGAAKSAEEFIEHMASYAIDVTNPPKQAMGFHPYLVVSVVFDRLPDGHEVDLWVSHHQNGASFKPRFFLKRSFDGFWVTLTSAWLNLADGPAKYFHVIHSLPHPGNANGARRTEILHSFTPVDGGKRLITKDLAEVFKDKKPISIQLETKADGAGALGLILQVGGNGVVQKVVQGSPAAKAGIEAGDLIAVINDVEISGELAEKLKQARITAGMETEIVFLKEGEKIYRSALALPLKLNN